MLASQRNARVHGLATIAVVLAGFLCSLTRWEWCVVVLAIAAVWSAEAFNTAIEALADAVSPREDPAIGKAKDIAAGAVLLAALGAAAAGLIIFGSRLVFFFSRIP